MGHLVESRPIGTEPFDTFIILSSNDHSLLFFTQSFAKLSGFHPSLVPSLIPISAIWVENLDIQRRVPFDRYEIYQFKQKTSLCNENVWVEDLIHELRTTSLAIDLGAHILGENEQSAPFLLQKLLRASHRQKISTLIASDFLQLLNSPPLISPTSLAKVLINGLSHSPAADQVKFSFASSIETNFIEHINPVIWCNFHFLANFFTTLLSWLETEPITLEMEVINPVSVLISLDISPNSLSKIQGFSLIPHYLHYITAYFNGRSWMTLTSIRILFPLVLSVLNVENSYKFPQVYTK